LGLEVSSVKDAARLISEIIRLSFFVGSSSSSRWNQSRPQEGHDEMPSHFG
jgi:hypothetical protein